MMKPDEIKKAFECCLDDVCSCEECPYFNIVKDEGWFCTTQSRRDALAYIEQLEAKVEMLNNECRETRRNLLNEIIRLEDQLETAKSEAVKEFAERLKEHFEAQRGHISEHYGLRSYWEDKYFYDYEIEDEIDKFVKEMEDE